MSTARPRTKVHLDRAAEVSEHLEAATSVAVERIRRLPAAWLTEATRIVGRALLPVPRSVTGRIVRPTSSFRKAPGDFPIQRLKALLNDEAES